VISFLKVMMKIMWLFSKPVHQYNWLTQARRITKFCISLHLKNLTWFFRIWHTNYITMYPISLPLHFLHCWGLHIFIKSLKFFVSQLTSKIMGNFAGSELFFRKFNLVLSGILGRMSCVCSQKQHIQWIAKTFETQCCLMSVTQVRYLTL